MAFKVYIVTPQSVGPGFDIPAVLNPDNIEPGCGAEVSLDNDPPIFVEVPPGSYGGASGELTWSGSAGGVDRIIRVEVYDDLFNLVDNPQVAGTTSVISVSVDPFDLPSGGFLTLRAGLGPGAPSGQQLIAGFLALQCGVGWTVGRVSWGSRGAWH